MDSDDNQKFLQLKDLVLKYEEASKIQQLSNFVKNIQVQSQSQLNDRLFQIGRKIILIDIFQHNIDIELNQLITQLLPQIEKEGKENCLEFLLIQLLPKTDLHCHLDGSVSSEFIHKQAQLQGIASIPSSLEEIRKQIKFERDSEGDFNTFLSRFVMPNKVLQKEESLKEAAFKFVELGVEDGLIYLEARFAPVLHTSNGLTIEEAILAVGQGLIEGKDKFGIEVGLSVAIIRKEVDDSESNFHYEVANAIISAAQKLQRIQLGIDIVGYEQSPPQKACYLRAYEAISEFNSKNLLPYNIHKIAHAGELEGTGKNIGFVCEKPFEVERVGHGIFVDLNNLNEKNKKPIYEVCPTSNYILSKMKSFEDHPFIKMLNGGLKITINTDARFIIETTCSNEFYQILSCTKEICLIKEKKISNEIIQIIMNGIDGAYLNEAIKEKIKNQVENQIEIINLIIQSLKSL